MADVDSDNEETTPAQTLLLEAMGHELRRMVLRLSPWSTVFADVAAG